MVATGPDRVVVLYSHPLLGEGLGRMLASESGIVVTTVSLDTIATLDDALACQPDVVVFEEGGPIGVLDVLRRSGATVVIDVDITSSAAWTLRRQPLKSDPEEVLRAIRDALAGRLGDPELNSGTIGLDQRPSGPAAEYRPITRRKVGPGAIAAGESAGRDQG